ncbi:MAG: ThiF family adenylyltransferase [Spirochaetia bacterium]
MTDAQDGAADLRRYSRQVLLPKIGADGQRRLAGGRALVMGVGALGTALASLLVRAGCGFVRLVDRDFIELDNLQRQALFDEEDIVAGLPKAVAAALKLRRANSSVTVEPVVADVTSANILQLLEGCNVVLDGSDNIETRLLLNDACLKLRVPWVYGAAIGMTGATMPIVPGQGPCFRCIVPSQPAPGALPTCETAGVLGTVPQMVAAFQVTEAIKLLTGHAADLVTQMRYVDAWAGTVEALEIRKGNDPCPACDLSRFEFLEGAKGGGSAKMCGRTAVQVDPGRVVPPDFSVLSARLSPLGEVRFNSYMLRFHAGDKEIVLFPDGRAIIKGTGDEGVARALYARYVGA